MFKIGETIVYSGSGVCTIENIGPIKLSGRSSGKSYYTLRPRYSQGVIYIPEDTDKIMRYVISPEIADKVIRQIPTMPDNIYTGDVENFCNEDYEKLFCENGCEDLIPFIKTIYVKPQAFTPMGKRIAKVDKNFVRQTEDVLYGELAEVLKLEKEDMREYIEKIIQSILPQKEKEQEQEPVQDRLLA
ncbi:MAG: CarD family transcriptional regulator [Oscillospiraceae bacterium]